ncbi:zinc dependent phospholipase C family protein [Clostridium beijerinckii]|uniref:zinc dependent phospholipase C family protein n=1 Tax=Clostridium beijerinckii TaxID=1520 RepID=UPI00030A14CE|nr:zinc dependent phospholipase C family protein [Clostridium beijerinckii]
MDTLLHGKIGYFLSKELIERGYSNIIDSNFFIYGNVLPDLKLKYRMTMHSKNEDWEKVIVIIDEIIYGEIKRNKDISIKLGILSHYLCDFFTFPHNKAFEGNIIRHELYEQTQRILWWKKLSEVWNECTEESRIELKSMNDIVDYIEDMHSIYIRNLGDKRRDIFFSNILVRVVSSSILKIKQNIDEHKVEENINRCIV